MPIRISKNPTTRTVAAQRLDASFNFDMSAFAAEAAGARVIDYTQIPVLPVSGARGRDGRGPFTYNIATVVANVRANGCDVPVFLNHETSKAYGWIDHKADPISMPDGTWEWPVRYTEEGLDLLRTEAYRYNSPTWLFLQDPAIKDRQAGEIVGLLENSLVNLANQYLRSLNSAEAATYTALIPAETNTDPEMTPEQLALIGLAEGATAEQITAALNSLKTSANRAEAIVLAAGAAADADAPAVVEAAANSRVTSGALVTKQAFDEVVTSRDAAVSAQSAAETALATFQAAQSEQAAVAAVDAAIVAGKYTPAARDGLLKQARNDLATFNLVTRALPVHPAAASANSVATRGVTDETHGLTAEHLELCSKNGIDPAIFAKNLRKTY